MLEQELQKIGLSEKEVKVYLSALELGPSPVQDIAKKSGVNRATTYVMIESLTERGLMSSMEKGKKHLFIAESPDRLLSLFRIQMKEVEQKEREFSRLLPELRLLHNISGEKPRVRFFEGREGLEAIREDILETKTTTKEVFVPLDEAHKFFPRETDQEFHKKIATKRAQEKIYTRTIYTSKLGSHLPTKEELRERRFIPPEKFPFHSEIALYGDKIAIFTYKEKLMGVIIESKEMTKSLRCLFDLAWETAEQYNQKI